MVTPPAASNVPLRKAIEETCPSAVARKLRMKRNEPGGRARLIGVRHHRRVEQRRGFERILVSEVSAEQQFSIFGEPLAIEQIGADLVKASAKELVDLQLAVAKLGANPVQQMMNVVLRQSHNPRWNFNGALIAHDPEGPRQHMRAVRVQGDGASCYVDWLHWVIGAVMTRCTPFGSFCRSRISASDRRNDSIDSAPWFWLLRSACSPSRQPPVSGA